MWKTEIKNEVLITVFSRTLDEPPIATNNFEGKVNHFREDRVKEAESGKRFSWW